MNREFNYYKHDGPNAFRFELAGHLSEDGAKRIEMDWHTAASVIGARHFLVDLTFVKAIDEAGRDLLLRWQVAGATFIASTKESKALVESAVGRCLEKAPEPPACQTPRGLLLYKDLLAYFIPAFRSMGVPGHEQSSLRFVTSQVRRAA